MNNLDLKVRFSQNPGIAANTPVLFEGNKVGVVNKVTYTEKGDYLMDITVESEFKNAATVDSSFHIANDPDHPEKSILVIEQAKPGGAVLEDGAMVSGAEQKSFFNQLFDNFATDLQASIQIIKKEFEKNSVLIKSGIADTIARISAQFQNIKEEVGQVPQRKEVQDLEKSLRQLRDQLMATEKSVRTEIQQEIIPKIQTEVEELKKRLKSSGREEEAKPLESELQKIRKV